MGEPQLTQKYTFEEYLEIDKKSELRCEYRNGDIFCTRGNNANHNIITMDLTMELCKKLRKKGYSVFSISILVEILFQKGYYYPSVVVTNEKTTPNQKIIRFPILIAEVLSLNPIIALRATSEKLVNYLENPHLQYYLIIAQNEVSVSLYERAEIGWVVKFFREMSDVISLDKMDISISVKDLYQEVYWENN